MHNRMASGAAAARPHLSTRLRVLFLAPKICWPLDTGAKLRTYHLAREVARDCDVTFAGFRDAASGAFRRSDATAPPEALFEQTVAVDHAGGYTPLKLLRGALGRTPVSVLNYTTPDMRAALEELLEAGDYDVVQVESVHMMAYLPALRAARNRPLLVCDWHNVESELMARYSRHAGSLPRRAYARLTARRLRQLERRALREFDAHVVVSERDRAQLLDIDPEARVFVVENGVDARHYEETARAVEAGRRVVFVGSMDYHANVDAAVRFARDIWPAIHRRHPELAFTVVGRNPSAEVRALGELPGVEVTGTVDDVRPYYRESLCSVVPLRIGGGSRLKILEAMAAGVPVVSTALGAEGLMARPGRDLMIADTPARLGAAIDRVLRDETARRRLAEAGRRFVCERYDWPALGGALRDLYARLLDRPAARAAAGGVPAPALAELGA